MRPLRRSLAPLLIAAALLATAAAPAPACGCGVALEAKAPRQTAFLSQRNGVEELVASFALSSSSAHAAVVVPVPNTPTVRAAPAGRDLFRYLAKATKPLVVPAAGSPPLTGGGPGGGKPVTVVGRRTIGGYDVATLRGGDADELNLWLYGHGYKLPGGAKPILDAYLKEGWSFVAIRLARRASGELKPLLIRFHTPRLVYPMRFEQLGTELVAIDLYTVARHRLRVPGLATWFARPLGKLKPAAPAGLKRYLSAGILTRLHGEGLEPSTLRHDYQPARARTDDEYWRAEPSYGLGLW